MKQIIILFTALLCLNACGSKQQQSGEGQPTLTVTLEPLRYFTEAIAGDKFKVTSMVPKGSSPETYDPTPQQLVSLDKSTAYLRIGYIGFEQAWMDKLTTNAPHLKIFDTSKGIDPIHEEGHDHGDHHHEGGIEPHIWNSARNASVIANNIYAALCELDNENTPYYKERLDSLQQVIAQTDAEVRELLQHADSTFLIYHPALSYFARDYGLKQISIEEGGKEPSPAHLRELIETCRRDNARVIFVQQEFDTRNAKLIADELGIKVIPINPLSYEWQEEMINVAKALKKP
ncbi:MAG: zinc ABC transporter substrate-binding protein [Bacteroides sp.]|nr:zinc ABC transporter substrate-binding protein [Bacteroides sp.]